MPQLGATNHGVCIYAKRKGSRSQESLVKTENTAVSRGEFFELIFFSFPRQKASVVHEEEERKIYIHINRECPSSYFISTPHAVTWVTKGCSTVLRIPSASLEKETKSATRDKKQK